MTVSDSRISGTLHYVEGYTGFSGDPDLQHGYYLAVKFEATEGATTTIQLIGGDVVRDPVELDSDMNAVLKITDPSKQRLKIVSTLDGHSDFVKIYRLPGLVLEAPSENNTVESDNGNNNNSSEPDNGEPAGE